jgi:D-glycero-beta-D-manno-heptose-7-phosphate kinase
MSKILVIGDSCKDIFIYGSIDRISPEAPVPVIKPLRQTDNPGMAMNVKVNLETLGADVNIITNPNSIKKIRYVDDKSNQMVIRVDEHDYCKSINRQQLSHIKGYDAVVISDYCKGFLEEKHIQHICEKCDNVFIDTKKILGSWVKDADFIKINSLEYSKNHDTIPNHPELDDKLIITKGKDGCMFRGKMFPVEEVHVKDVSGAGDTFLSGLVVEYLRTNDIEKAIIFAQECTTRVVQKLGVSTI